MCIFFSDIVQSGREKQSKKFIMFAVFSITQSINQSIYQWKVKNYFYLEQKVFFNKALKLEFVSKELKEKKEDLNFDTWNKS